MNGIHDMGGMDGFGKVVPDQRAFHAEWERRVFSLLNAVEAAGAWNIDQFRFGIERLPPEVYLTSSYFKRWHLMAELLLREGGYVSAAELAAGHAIGPPKPLPCGTMQAHQAVAETFVSGAFGRPARYPAVFTVGDTVRTRNIHLASHTRLPRYARGHTGLVERVLGCHVFPDANVTGADENPQWLYAVAFNARDLWGDVADPTVKVFINAFEPYLTPA